jgi:hypothetical protein
MTFTFSILNVSGIISVHSGQPLQLNLFVQDNFHPLPTNMDINYTLLGNPNVVFGNGTRSETHPFPHNNTIENFWDTITLTSTDGQNHLVRVIVTCVINGDSVQQFVDVNIFVP